MAMVPQVSGDRTPYAASSSGKLKARSTMSMKRSGGGTPYERPRRAQPLAQRDTRWTGAGIGAGIVHSASRILTKSAVFLFNSMFKRQAPSITAPPEDSEDVPPLEIAQPVEVMESERDDVLILPANGEAKVAGDLQADDLENILKQKELTREECERYINLIQSKIMDTAPEPGPSSPVRATERHTYRNTRAVFSPESQRSESHMETDQALVPWEELPPRPSPGDRRVKFQHPPARSERWTPIQMPIGGGRELLKQRATVSNERSPGSSRPKDVSPSKASFSLRGPSLVPGPALKRKTSSEAMDLACFRSATGTTKRKPSLRLDVPSIPGQSSRTAQRILDTLERRSPFKNPEPDDSTAARPPKSRVSALKTSAAPASVFSFPSTANGPEPPTPKPMPSPYGDEKKTRDGPVQLNHVRNGLLPSFQDTGFDKLPGPFSNGPDSSLYSGEELFERFVQRVEKASSILSGDGAGVGVGVGAGTGTGGKVAPSLTNSPSFSNGAGFPSPPATTTTTAAAATGIDLTSNSWGRWDELASSTNPFQGFSSGSLTGFLTSTTTSSSITTSGTIMTTQSATCSTTVGGGGGFEVKERSLFEAWKSPSSSSSDQLWLGAAQSLAPPDSNPALAPAPPSNGGFAKRKKSSKRLK